MIIAEDFERCEMCNQGWFEKKEFVLIQKDSPLKGKPMINKTEVQFQCVGCGHAQYTYTEEN